MAAFGGVCAANFPAQLRPPIQMRQITWTQGVEEDEDPLGDEKEGKENEL